MTDTEMEDSEVKNAVAPTSDHGDAWRVTLRDALDRVMADPGKGLDARSYLKVYTELYDAVGKGTKENAIEFVGDYLSEYLRRLSVRAHSLVGQALLSFYVDEWTRYRIAAKYNTSKLLRYLDRQAVDGMDPNRIYNLHTTKWQNEFVRGLWEKVEENMLDILDMRRNGMYIAPMHMKVIVGSFEYLQPVEANYRDNYTVANDWANFKTRLVARAGDYYRQEAARSIATDGAVGFIRKACVRLDDEEAWTRTHVEEELRGSLITACCEGLLADHTTLVRNTYERLVDANMIEDLIGLCRLCSRTAGESGDLPGRFLDFLRQTCQDQLKEMVGQSQPLRSRVYVDTLVDIRTRYYPSVAVSYERESGFLGDLNGTYRELVNCNLSHEVDPSTSSSSSQLLAEYIDQFIRDSRANTGGRDNEAALQKALLVFGFVQEKELFQQIYGRMLTKRLIDSPPHSLHIEDQVIDKLTEVGGLLCTHRLRMMLWEMRESRGLTLEYSEWHSDELRQGVEDVSGEASFQILDAGLWPLEASNDKFTPPLELECRINSFERFYGRKRAGRNLTWLWHSCKGEMRAYFEGRENDPYILRASTYQMAVLLLFNERTAMDYVDIAERTGLPNHTLSQVMKSLTQSHLILTGTRDTQAATKVTYTLNSTFRSKKTNVRLDRLVTACQNIELNKARRAVREDRTYTIQAAIVRIMKASRTLKQVELIRRVLEECKDRFIPVVADVEKTIDVLMNREYLELLEEKVLGYIA